VFDWLPLALFQPLGSVTLLRSTIRFDTMTHLRRLGAGVVQGTIQASFPFRGAKNQFSGSGSCWKSINVRFLLVVRGLLDGDGCVDGDRLNMAQPTYHRQHVKNLRKNLTAD
jgi:hypothetical protein